MSLTPDETSTPDESYAALADSAPGELERELEVVDLMKQAADTDNPYDGADTAGEGTAEPRTLEEAGGGLSLEEAPE